MPSERPAVFLDRDGTVIEEVHYLADPEAVTLLPGAASLSRLSAAGYALILVTNQSGIARGLLDESDHAAVQERLAGLLDERGVALDGVYYCPHHPDITGPCACRKPGLALFERAIREHRLDPKRSVWVGDRLRDVLPALALGGRPLLVRTGYGGEGAAAEVEVVADLAEAVQRVLDDRTGD